MRSVLAAACLIVCAAAARATEISVPRVDTAEIYNPCVDEVLTFTWYGRLSIRSSAEADLLRLDLRDAGTGRALGGKTGAAYTTQYLRQVLENHVPGQGFSTSWTVEQSFKGQGAVPEYLYREQMRLTINASGGVTLTRDRAGFVCPKGRATQARTERAAKPKPAIAAPDAYPFSGSGKPEVHGVPPRATPRPLLPPVTAGLPASQTQSGLAEVP